MGALCRHEKGDEDDQDDSSDNQSHSSGANSANDTSAAANTILRERQVRLAEAQRIYDSVTEESRPAKPAKPYTLFQREQFRRAQMENPDISFQEAAKLVSAKWKEINENEKQRLNDQAAEEQRRYELAISQLPEGYIAAERLLKSTKQSQRKAIKLAGLQSSAEVSSSRKRLRANTSGEGGVIHNNMFQYMKKEIEIGDVVRVKDPRIHTNSEFWLVRRIVVSGKNEKQYALSPLEKTGKHPKSSIPFGGTACWKLVGAKDAKTVLEVTVNAVSCTIVPSEQVVKPRKKLANDDFGNKTYLSINLLRGNKRKRVALICRDSDTPQITSNTCSIHDMSACTWAIHAGIDPSVRRGLLTPSKKNSEPGILSDILYSSGGRSPDLNLHLEVVEKV